MKLTKNEQDEWSRCARAAYKNNENSIGHFLSVCSAQNEVVLSDFDRASLIYHNWLNFNTFGIPKIAASFTLWGLCSLIKAKANDFEKVFAHFAPEYVNYFYRHYREGSLYTLNRKDGVMDLANYCIN